MRKYFLLCALLLAACNSESDSAPESASPADVASGPVTAEGAWSGYSRQAIAGGAVTRNASALVLGNGDFYLMLSSLADPQRPASVIQGSAQMVDGRLVASTATMIDFESKKASAVRVSGQYSVAAKTGLSAEITQPGSATIGVASAFQNSYNTMATVAGISGTYKLWLGSAGGLMAGEAKIGASGGVTATFDKCQIAGRVTLANKALLNLALDFKDGCPLKGTYAGPLFYDALTKQLLASGPAADRADGFLIYGYRSGS